MKRADFIRYWRRSGLKNPDKPKIFIKKNVRNHSYHQFYPILAKIRINRGLLYMLIIGLESACCWRSKCVSDIPCIAVLIMHGYPAHAVAQSILMRLRHCSGVALGIAFAYGWKLTLVTVAFVPLIAFGGFLEVQLVMGGESAEKQAYDEAGWFIANRLLEFSVR